MDIVHVMLEIPVKLNFIPRTIRIMVAGSVRNRSARARTLIRSNSRGRSKAGRIISCLFGLNRPTRAEGLITGVVAFTLRGFLIGHKSMLESRAVVNLSKVPRLALGMTDWEYGTDVSA